MSLVQAGTSDSVKKGIEEFLKRLSVVDLYALVHTTTQNLIVPDSVPEAISVITQFSDAVSLLNRRRIKKEFLLKYLISKNVNVTLPIDKTKLCLAVLKLWGYEVTKNLTFMDVELQEEPNQQTSIDDAFEGNSGQAPRVHESTLSLPVGISEDEPMDAEYNFNQGLIEENLRTAQALGKEFAKWFYQKWNDLDDFGPHHFWPECNLSVELTNALGTDKQMVTGGAESCNSMRNMKIAHRLTFNPNLMDGNGVRGMINPHGLAQVFVCGTLFSGSNEPTGTFEQVFGLIQDPNDKNNYKIKFTMIRFREGRPLEVSSSTDIFPAITE